MFRSSSRIITTALCVIATLFPVTAIRAQAQTAIQQTGTQQTGTPASPFAGAALDDSALQTIAGREDVAQISTSTQVAGVSQNSVGDNVQTGDARISDNAFQNLSGLSILNVNTGNNVAINATMNVNIAISPAP
jgi:hypothetical protein